jgi:acyl-CoA thioesterase
LSAEPGLVRRSFSGPCAHAGESAGCELPRQLQLTPVGDRTWRGSCRSGRAVRGRAYGGHIAGHALLAAWLTVGEDREPHSMHLYFLEGGDTAEEFDYQVEPLRDGRSFSVRQVTVRQAGRHTSRAPRGGVDRPYALVSP